MKTAIVLFLATFFATSALASKSVENIEQKSRKTVRTDARGKPITVVDFEEANIEGSAKSPEGFVVQSRSGSSFRNIIELRRNFRPQIRASEPSGMGVAGE